MSKTNYHPIGNRVLLRTPTIIASEEKIDGIILPKEQIAMHRLKTQSAFLTLPVDACGPECKQIQVGDVVIFNRHQVHPLPIDSEDLYFITEEVVIAIVKPAP
jgi:co-chaperonin GroES (HSP10)